HHLIGHRDVEIGFPDGGLGDLYAPAARSLLEAARSTVETGVRVVSFLGEGDRVGGVRLEDGRSVQAAYCVAAVPPSALFALSRPEWTRPHLTFAHLKEFRPVPYISLFLWFDRKLTDLQFWARAHSPADLNCDFYDLSNIHSGWVKRPSL